MDTDRAIEDEIINVTERIGIRLDEAAQRSEMYGEDWGGGADLISDMTELYEQLHILANRLKDSKAND